MWSESSSKNQDPTQNVKTLDMMKSSVSLAQPEPIDLQQTKELEIALTEFDVIASDEELNYREGVLSKLNEMVKEWIFEICLAHDVPQEVAEQVGGKIYSSGLYRLGVHQRGDRIEAVCVAPRLIDRSYYFSTFYEKLKNRPEIKELRAIEETFVPVLKMNFDGIDVSLSFARLALKEIPDTLDLSDDMILKNLDPRCIRSLHECRMSDEILRLVPNVETFRLALHVIKLWAKQHGIYSNVLGYFGGISWAILVAKTCQLYPNAVASTIIQKFFSVFSQWNWPDPVSLKRPTKCNSNLPVWNSGYNMPDQAKLIPIISPTYPHRNSTFNVSRSTFKIVVDELRTGFRISEAIMRGRANWQMLFEKPNFFAKYKHLMFLIASSSTNDEHLEWRGLIEAKVWHLVTFLERNPGVCKVHVNPEIFELTTDYFKNNGSDSPKENDQVEQKPNSMWVLGLEFNEVKGTSLNLTPEIQDFTNAVMRHANGIKMYRETMKIVAKYSRRKNLNDYLPINIIRRDRPENLILAPIIKDATPVVKVKPIRKSDTSIDEASGPKTKVFREQ
ncbi:poly(A) polymerase type 3-like [Planococcus citri]|uniref:poly(A) polymerase type 3-like n=1 Tax=Planococcus citri TaxID=170843 RepID=UPI0031F8E470